MKYFKILLLGVIISFSFSYGQTIDRSISADSDDAEENSSNGATWYMSNDLDLGQRIVGLRFGDISIPQGATITNAYVQFTANEGVSGTASLLIKGNDTDNASTFTGDSHNISGRTSTTASVSWSPGNWSNNSSGSAQRTPDISSIIQEIVDRNGWVSGNHVAFIIENGGTNHPAQTFSHGTTPQLHIEYSVGTSVVLGDGELTIEFQEFNNGRSVKLAHIKRNNTELLNVAEGGRIFEITVDEPNGTATYTNLSTWTTAKIGTNQNNTQRYIVFTRQNLKVTLDIRVNGSTSNWEMSVTQIDQGNSLLEAKYPSIDLIANTNNNDNIFIPKFDGRVFPNPVDDNIQYEFEYPRGFGNTMQYVSYYNDNYGIYLGAHDKKASIKTFIVNRNGNGVRFEIQVPAKDAGVEENNWGYPGRFWLNIFDGDWFDASLIYKDWVFNNANYRPQPSTARNIRQNKLGDISFWITSKSGDVDIDEISTEVIDYANYVGVPSALHWFGWNGLNDENTGVPDVYHPRAGMKDAVVDMKDAGVTVMPYTNGRLYDRVTNPTAYAAEGTVWATKDLDGQPHEWGNYAVMCPTVTAYQNTVININDNLIDNQEVNGMYIDQVCASEPIHCTDPNHSHTIGGGHFWRDGYNQMFQRVHAENPNIFIVSEGSADFIADEVDGYLVDSWHGTRDASTHYQMVPAFQVVYSGTVQLLGSGSGSTAWVNPQFFCKQARGIVNGVAPGRISYYLHASTSPARADALHYSKRLGQIRNELKDFLAFGEMQRPLEIAGNDFSITSDWRPKSEVFNVTIQSVQSAVWKDENGNILVIFANASRTHNENINFSFVGNNYGLTGNIQRREFWTNSNTNEVVWGGTYNSGNTFDYFANHNYPVNALQIRGFIFGHNLQKSVSEKTGKNFTYRLEQNYPNPFNPSTVINFSIADAGNTKIEVFNILGQKVMTLLNRDLEAGSHNVEFNASNLSSGIYFYKLQSNNFTSIKKMMLLK